MTGAAQNPKTVTSTTISGNPSPPRAPKSNAGQAAAPAVAIDNPIPLTMVLRPQPRRAMAAGMPHLLEHIAFSVFVEKSLSAVLPVGQNIALRGPSRFAESVEAGLAPYRESRKPPIRDWTGILARPDQTSVCAGFPETRSGGE
jgi:hypothetical protein